MKAYQIILPDVSNDNEGSLKLHENISLPDVSADEVLIKVAACGLNRADIFQRQGLYPPPKGASEIPGLEVSGVIESLGADVSAFQVGDEVCALLEGGGYAEYVSVRASQVLPKPKHLSLVEAAALPETFFTVWYNLFDKAQLSNNETVLVHGASSGIGVTTIALCKMLNLSCIATTTSKDKIPSLKQLGAKEILLSTDGNLVEQVKHITAGKGVDVILDMVGGDSTAANLRMLGFGGRLAIIALLAGAKTEVNLGAVLLKNLTITGATLRNQAAGVKASVAAALLKRCWLLLELHSYRPEIARVYTFSEALKAQSFMQENRHIGKIILQLV